MQQTNLTEMFRERQLTLLRDAEDRRLARRLREHHSHRFSRPERGRLGAGVRRTMALWGMTSIPFFRA